MFEFLLGCVRVLNKCFEVLKVLTIFEEVEFFNDQIDFSKYLDDDVLGPGFNKRCSSWIIGCRRSSDLKSWEVNVNRFIWWR
jgi:hypothetical protein